MRSPLTSVRSDSTGRAVGTARNGRDVDRAGLKDMYFGDKHIDIDEGVQDGFIRSTDTI